MSPSDPSTGGAAREAIPVRQLSQPPPERLGRYRLSFELGTGGMATVYLARMEGAAGFEKAVALKTIHPHLAKERTFIDMFLDEAHIASQIDHPNVCTVFDFGEERGTYYIAMEYLVGEPLLRVVNTLVDERRKDLLQALPFYAARIIAEACEGLHAAHELGGSTGDRLDVVHRDVSPQNLFITYEGAVKVVDFGCAKATQRISQTATGTLKGKVAYAAPEQMRPGPVDRRADVWALGVCLWELLTLKQLFRRESDVQTALAVLEDPIPLASDGRAWVPPGLAKIAARALSRDPDARPQNARDMGRELRQFLTRAGHTVEKAELADFMNDLFGDGRKRHSLLLEEARQSAAPVDAIDAIDAIEAIEAGDTEPPPPAEGARLRLSHEDASGPRSRRPGGLRLPLALIAIVALLAGGAFLVYAKGLLSGAGGEETATVPEEASTSPTPPRPAAAAPSPTAPRPSPTPAAAEGAGEVPTGEAPTEDLPDPAASAGVTVEGVGVTPQTGRGTGAEAPTTSGGTDRHGGGRAGAESAESGGAAAGRGDGTATGEGALPAGGVGSRVTTEAEDPEEVPPPPAVTGSVQVLASGGWSVVYEGERELGRTPVTITLPSGRHRLRLLPFGREPGDVHTVNVVAGSTTTIRVGIRSSGETAPTP